MPRDKVIKRSFEIADDGMQGVIGYFFYGLACKKLAPEDQFSRDSTKRRYTNYTRLGSFL